MAASDDVVGMLPNFAGAEDEVDCLFRPEGVVFLTLVFPVTSVTLQGGDLELLERLGSIQQQELILDALSESPIELTIESHIIPS